MDKLLRLPPFQALQALVQVARTGSFTEAARALHLTQSAISRQIQQLEEHYGQALFERTSRKTLLTAAGHEVRAVASSVLEQMSALDARLAPVPLERPFRIRIFVSLAIRWLLPRLGTFYSANPGLCLSIESVGGEVVDDGGDCDAYVLYLPKGDERQAWPLTALFDEYLLPVCAPTLNYGGPLPSSVAEMRGHALVHGSPGRTEWMQWLQAHGETAPGDINHILFNLDDLALDAATRGLGIAVTDRILAHDALVRGDLVVPFGTAQPTGARYALWLRDSGAAHPGCAAVLRWFEQQVRDAV